MREKIAERKPGERAQRDRERAMRLLAAIGEAEDTFVEQAEIREGTGEGAGTSGVRGQRRGLRSIFGARGGRRRRTAEICVACFALAAGIGLWIHFSGVFTPGSGTQHAVPEEQGISAGEETGDENIAEDKTYVDVQELIGEEEGISADGEVLETQWIRIGERTAEYHRVNTSEGSARLAESLGEPLAGASGYYRLAGHEELQYLIREQDETYSLWEFSSFVAEEGESYGYDTVLREIYGLTGADQIASVTVTPADMDNTDQGRALQEQIGTRIVTDPDEIDTLYRVLVSMTCLGSKRWEQIGVGREDASLLEDVRMGRYLAITLKSGVVIDDLKYTANTGQFYEYEGIAYRELSPEDAAAVEQVLGIGEE